MRKGGGSGVPKLFFKFWWSLFLALKTRLFLAKSDIWIPKCIEGGGGIHRFRKYSFFPLKSKFIPLSTTFLQSFAACSMNPQRISGPEHFSTDNAGKGHSVQMIGFYVVSDSNRGSFFSAHFANA